VEDHPGTLQSLGLILRQAGYSPLLATNAQQALELLDSQPVDCVLMDYQLPGGGEHFGPQIRSARPDIPIIVLSGDPGAVAARDFADLLLGKPVPPPVLLGHIARLMSQASAKQAA
jgi:CheY-like chemotaxis protein